MPASVEIQVPLAIVNGKVNITATNTQQQLSATSVPLAKGVTVKALTANAATVYVGAAGLDATTGFPLDGGDSVGIGINDLNKVYIYGTQNDDVAYISN